MVVLKETYKKRHSSIKRTSAIRSGNDEYPKFVARDEIIVDVRLKEKAHTNREVELSIEDLFKHDDEYIIVSANSGVGKTTMTETLAHKWANGEIWKSADDENRYDFVFALYCRRLNKYQNEQIDIADVLEREFKEIFSYVTIDDLRRKKNRVLLIIEGLDETACFDDLKEMNEEQMAKFSKYAQLIFDAINPNSSIAPFHHLVTCRSGTDFDIVKKFQCKIKQLVLPGFTKDDQNAYIVNFFSESSQVAERVLQKLGESPIFDALSQNPFYLWVFCSLAQEELLSTPKTCSDVYASVVLLFYRNQGWKSSNKSLFEFVKSEHFKKSFLQITELAFETLKRKDILFSKDSIEMGDIQFNDALQNSALITKVHENDFAGESYQFAHLIIHEFLAAYHVFYHNAYMNQTEQLNLFSQPSFLLFLSGLLGSSSQSTSSLYLLTCMRKKKANSLDYKKEMLNLLNNATLFIESQANLYMEMYFEYQNPIQCHTKMNCTLTLLTSLQPSSFDTIRLKYLFGDIKSSRTSFPFRRLIIDTTQVPSEIIDLIKPYLKDVDYLNVYSCYLGTVKMFSEFLPFINEVYLPYDGMDFDDWVNFSERIEKAKMKHQLKLRNLIVRSSTLEFLPDFAIEAFCNIENLIIPELIIKPNQLKLVSESTTLRYFAVTVSYDTFKQFCQEIHSFRNTLCGEIRVLQDCNHSDEEERRKKSEKYRGKSVSNSQFGDFIFDDPREIIVCKKCVKKIQSIYEKYLLTKQPQRHFNLLRYVAISVVSNEIVNGKALFSWTFILSNKKDIIEQSRQDAMFFGMLFNNQNLSVDQISSFIKATFKTLFTSP